MKRKKKKKQEGHWEAGIRIHRAKRHAQIPHVCACGLKVLI